MGPPASGRYELQVFRDRPDPTTRAYFRFGRSSLLPGGLGSGSETEFRGREKGPLLQNEFCHYWLISGSGPQGRNSTDLTPVAIGDRG